MTDGLHSVDPTDPASWPDAPEKPPVRRTTAARDKPAARKPAARSIEQDIAALLIQANIMLAPILKDDVMDDVEILSLAKAIDEQAKTSPRFRAALQRMFTMMGGTGLVGVVVVIAARRAARHGLIGREWDQNLASYLALSQMSPAAMMRQMEETMSAVMAAQAMAAAQAEENDAATSPPTQPGPVPAEAPRTA